MRQESELYMVLYPSLFVYFLLFTSIALTGRTLDDVVLNGTIKIPNLSEENEIDEVEVCSTASMTDLALMLHHRQVCP